MVAVVMFQSHENLPSSLTESLETGSSNIKVLYRPEIEKKIDIYLPEHFVYKL